MSATVQELETKGKTPSGLRGLLRVLIYLSRYRGLAGTAIGLLLFVIAIDLSLPQIIGWALTGLQRDLEGGAPFDPWKCAAIFIGLIVVRDLIRFAIGRIRNWAVQLTLADIRADLFDSIQRLSFAYHDRTRTGELVSRATSDVSRLQEFLFATMYLVVDIVLSLTGSAVLLFWIDARLATVVVAAIAICVALTAHFARQLHPRWRKVHDRHGELTTVIHENIAGVRVVRAFAREPEQCGKFRDRRNAFAGAEREAVFYWAGRVPMAQFVFGLSIPYVLWAGGSKVIAGTMPVGDLGKAIFYLMGMGFRMGAVGHLTNIIQNASASAQRVMEVMDEPREVKEGTRLLPVRGKGRVAFEQVSFHYREAGKPSLTEVSFEIEPGCTVAIVGPTGSGKTTLVNLIPRFYDPESGRILVDGIDVRDLRLPELRRNVAVIFQETFLFTDTVANNIAYGRPGSSMDEIRRCSDAAQASEFIQELPDGYETLIGERGVSLSGGQKQRLAIARAFLMDPRILILDDATASVDSKTERLIQGAMRKLSTGRTTFVIAHRHSTVQHADVILVLKEGRVAERGTHDELLAKGGFYSEIFAEQITAD